MLLPKGGFNWKAARAQLPPSRAVWSFVTRTRFLLGVALTGVILLLWRGISTAGSEMQRCVRTASTTADTQSGNALTLSCAFL